MAAEKGGREVALPVLAATLTTVVVFFPVTFLYGVSKFLFSALALAVVLSLFASYAVAMTVVPLFCARFIKAPAHHGTPSSEMPVTVDHAATTADAQRTASTSGSTTASKRSCGSTTGWSGGALRRPALTLRGVRRRALRLSLAMFPLLGLSFFPRTDAGPVRHQPESADRHAAIDVTESEVAKVEALVRRGGVAGGSGNDRLEHRRRRRTSRRSTRTNSAMHTAFVQVSLKEDHKIGSYEYMARVQAADRARAAGAERLLPIRRPGGRGAESGPAGADRRAGGGLQHGDGVRHGAGTGRARSARSPAWPTSSFRRTSTIRRCSWISTARAPANSGWISGKWSAT